MKGKTILLIAFSLFFSFTSHGQKPTPDPKLDSLPHDPAELAAALNKLAAAEIKSIPFYVSDTEAKVRVPSVTSKSEKSSYSILRVAPSRNEMDLIQMAEAVYPKLPIVAGEGFILPSSIRAYRDRAIECVHPTDSRLTNQCELKYRAVAQRHKRYSVDGKALRDVIVVKMNLSWSIKCGPALCSSGYKAEKTVVFTKAHRPIALILGPSIYIDS